MSGTLINNPESAKWSSVSNLIWTKVSSKQAQLQRAKLLTILQQRRRGAVFGYKFGVKSAAVNHPIGGDLRDFAD